MNFSQYTEAIIVERVHVRSKTYKVRIPSIMPDSNTAINSTKGTPVITNTNRVVNKNIAVEDQIQTIDYIEAANHTYFYERLRGDIPKEKMDHTDGITEKSEDPSPDGSADDIIAHDHDIKKPLGQYKLTFEKLNNFYLEPDTKVYGFFINGAADTTRFAVTYVDCMVTFSEEDGIPYEE